ncbi:MAG: 5'-methylthioadenosine/S-adenosylhomocysteine nucleosidase [Gammaproteobacteria bacterium]
MIGIIAAMQEETAFLQQQMTDITLTSIAGNEFLQGKIRGHNVVLVQAGIGKVNAAIGTALLIDRFKARCVINTGSAGGLNEALNIGDVVISIEVRHHDVDVTVFGYEHGQIPKLPAAFLPNHQLVDAATRAAHKMDMHVTQGLIVSGDSFVNEPAYIARIHEKFKNVHAVEMEAAAVAQVCHQFDVPFVVIRALSDIAGKESAISFETFLKQAAQNSAQLILFMLDEM